MNVSGVNLRRMWLRSMARQQSIFAWAYQAQSLITVSSAPLVTLRYACVSVFPRRCMSAVIAGRKCFVRSSFANHVESATTRRSTDMRASAGSASMSVANDRDLAVQAVAAACRVARAIAQPGDVSAQAKHDASPVTIADYAVQAVIARAIRLASPSDKLVAEESADALRKDSQLLTEVSNAVRIVDSQASDSHVLEALYTDPDAAAPGGTAEGRVWVLDPIDGTRGFVAGRQYCIALALLEHGQPKIGVLGCPNLPVSSLDSRLRDNPSSVHTSGAQCGVVFHAVKGSGAFAVSENQVFSKDSSSNIRDLSDTSMYNGEIHPDGLRLGRRIHTSTLDDPSAAIFCESFEAAHSSHELSARIASILGVKEAPVRMDSQAKYGAMARGDFHIFMRFPRESYVENIWDHAAGAVVLEEAGGRVTDGTGRSLNFALGRHLDNNDGIIASNGSLHDAVIAAVQTALKEQHRSD